MDLDVISKKFKPIALSSLYGIGFFDLMRLLQRQRVTILMYHRFSEKPEPFKLAQKVFSRQLHYLSHKYSLISFNDYVQVLCGERSDLPPNPLIITIDDGYQDNYEYAYPVLKKYNAPATIFLTTDFISHKAWLWSNQLEYILKSTSKVHFSFPIDGADKAFHVDSFAGWHQTQLALYNYCCRIPDTEKDLILADLALLLGVSVPDQVTDQFLPLTWDQIREMQNNGISYGSHSCSHSIMSRLTPDSLCHELVDSKKEIESHIHRSVDVFCYPNGQPDDISDNVVEQVQNSGYSAAVTTNQGANRLMAKSSPFLLTRLSIGDHAPAVWSRILTDRYQSI